MDVLSEAVGSIFFALGVFDLAVAAL